MSRLRIYISYKVLFALLGLGAVVTEVTVLIERGMFNIANFFSYFTIESNILLAGALLTGAFALAARSKSKYIDYFRGATTFYMIVVGVIFSLLLSGYDELTAVPWDNTVLHYIMPIIALADWLIDPPKSPIRFKKAVWWLLFPLVYLVYSLVRGAIVGWYPYPFLNLETNGFGGVSIIAAGIFIFGVVLIYALMHIPNFFLHKRRHG